MVFIQDLRVHPYVHDIVFYYHTCIHNHLYISDTADNRRDANESTERKEVGGFTKGDTGYGNPYLTPASRRDLIQEKCNELQCRSSREECSVQNDENVALLLECRTAVFSNSLESEDEDMGLKQPFQAVS